MLGSGAYLFNNRDLEHVNVILVMVSKQWQALCMGNNNLNF